MARSRSLPSNLFDVPDFFELSSNTQIVLIGLVLAADDYGRGQAHTNWLARKLNKELSCIEQALVELETRHLVQRYQGEGQHYYVLTQWDEWETLSRPTPSKYPAPPSLKQDERFQQFPGDSQQPQEIAGNAREIHSEEEEEEEREEEGEGEEETSSNVVLFPTLIDGDGVDAQKIHEVTHQAASILKLKVTDALTRIVQEYHADPTLSLLGEADAAREWVDDSRRNRKKQRITPAFFRRWLKREQTAQHRAASLSQAQATGTTGQAIREGICTPGQSPEPSKATGLAGKSLMHLETAYQQTRSSPISPHDQEGDPS